MVKGGNAKRRVFRNSFDPGGACLAPLRSISTPMWSPRLPQVMSVIKLMRFQTSQSSLPRRSSKPSPKHLWQLRPQVDGDGGDVEASWGPVVVCPSVSLPGFKRWLDAKEGLLRRWTFEWL
ncbi:hypothetical protein H257_00949 [Aphanomyces astaci]|uniref:Uncharacterized protein n=1 Tax=Aphanomyces astaci TaxID=112090 RepID=W4H7Q5_APHAT|nr:hypothetical protein H257_00949 [Aphanomyces astaci]ETV87334.1 hypothetical protein H257_00949 [Aphanomyces astaci]|eukprot:XP_009822197.1 hypothetical protein H257_00949 [Aphanomyces astaci]